MLTVALPNKGALSEGVTAMLSEAGYRCRPDGRGLTVLDPTNGVRFYFLRPRDVAVYVGRGQIDLGITGRDLALDSGATVTELLALGIGSSQFLYAGPTADAPDGGWSVEALAGRRVATSYPRLVADDLAARGIEAEIVRLEGAVEISVELGVADLVADVVSTGRTLAAHGLEPFGPVLCTSEAVVVGPAVGRTPARADPPPSRTGDQIATPVSQSDHQYEGGAGQFEGGADGGGGDSQDPVGDAARHQLLRRLEGVTVAQQYVMVDYDCPRDLLDAAVTLTPGLESPTVAPLRDEAWVAVRALVPKAEMNVTIDALADLGAKAILASDLRSARL